MMVQARILRVGRDALLISNPSQGGQVVVNYPYAYHFCAGQRVSIQYVKSEGNVIDAVDIYPAGNSCR
jgi:hypothetical protein